MAGAGISRPYRVLVVEEDRERAHELRNLFSQDGYECEVTLDLETADEVISDRRMEAVVVDLGIDGVSADEALDVFRPVDEDCGVILFNGSTDDAEQRRYRRQGADSYLSHRSDLDRVVNAVYRNISDGQ